MVGKFLILLFIILFLYLYVMSKLLCINYSNLLSVVNRVIFFLSNYIIIILNLERVRDVRRIGIFNSFFVCFYLSRGPPSINRFKEFIDWRILKWEIAQKEENIGIIHIN